MQAADFRFALGTVKEQVRRKREGGSIVKLESIG